SNDTDKLSGFELFVTVWFVPAGGPDGLRRYRGKTIRRVRASCLRAHADRSTVADHSAVSPPNLCLAWRYAKLSVYQQSQFASHRRRSSRRPLPNLPARSRHPVSWMILPTRL